MNNRMEVPVKQPLTFAGLPEGGTVTGTPGTPITSDPIFIGDAKSLSIALQVSNVSGSTHALIQYEESVNYHRPTDTGDWTAVQNIVADLTDDDTESLYALSPNLCMWIRIKFSGAAANGAFNRMRGNLMKQ